VADIGVACCGGGEINLAASLSSVSIGLGGICSNEVTAEKRRGGKINGIGIVASAARRRLTRRTSFGVALRVKHLLAAVSRYVGNHAITKCR